MRDYVIGIDVGGTRVKMGLFDAGMQLIAEQKYLTDKDGTVTELISFLAQQTRALVEKAGLTLGDIRGVGAAFPSSVDFKRGVTLESGSIVALGDQPVRDMLRQRLRPHDLRHAGHRHRRRPDPERRAVSRHARHGG